MQRFVSEEAVGDAFRGAAREMSALAGAGRLTANAARETLAGWLERLRIHPGRMVVGANEVGAADGVGGDG